MVHEISQFTSNICCALLAPLDYNVVVGKILARMNFCYSINNKFIKTTLRASDLSNKTSNNHRKVTKRHFKQLLRTLNSTMGFSIMTIPQKSTFVRNRQSILEFICRRFFLFDFAIITVSYAKL